MYIGQSKDIETRNKKHIKDLLREYPNPIRKL